MVSVNTEGQSSSLRCGESRQSSGLEQPCDNHRKINAQIGQEQSNFHDQLVVPRPHLSGRVASMINSHQMAITSGWNQVSIMITWYSVGLKGRANFASYREVPLYEGILILSKLKKDPKF